MTIASMSIQSRQTVLGRDWTIAFMGQASVVFMFAENTLLAVGVEGYDLVIVLPPGFHAGGPMGHAGY